MACSASSAATSVAATPNRWIFTAEQLADTPSRKCGIDSEKEANYRQQAASLIQDMGQKLQVTQLCINTAIVYMHRFYMFHSFIKFNRTSMAGSCLFLAAKVEEQPRKLEHVVRTGYMCTHRDQPPLDVKSDLYLELAQELVINENILLQTLGFEITVDHPHTHIVKTCTMCKASKDLAQTSYFLATNSLHLTSMCLQYPPTVVACICIHLACKWSSFEIPQSNEGKAWFSYVDPEVTSAVLEEITQDFLSVLERCPSKIRKKLTNHKMCDDMSFSSADINININMNINKRPVKSEPSASQSVSSEHSDQLPVSAVSTLPATIEQTSSPGPSQLRPGPATSSSFKPTNHDRIMSSGLKALEHVEKSEQSSAAKETVKIASGVDAVDTPTLRRVKTEASTLSTKEYFERKQREKQEREAAVAKMMQFRSQQQLVGETNSLSSHQKPVKVPETNHAGIEREATGADVLGHADQTDALPGVVKLEPGISDMTPSAKYTSSNSAARMVKQVDHQAQSKTHGMGDPSDQRTSNIFERMGDANFKGSKLHASATPEGRAEVLKVEAAAAPTPGRPQLSVASDMADTHLSQSMSYSQEPHRHDRRSHGPGAPSNLFTTGEIAQLKESRSRSGRHDSAGALLTSPVKSVGSEMNSFPTLTAEQRGSKRKRSTGGSEQQPSPIKLTLPVTPSSASESSHVASPQKPRPSGSSHNRSSAAVEPPTSAGLSDSQNERIRLKLSLTELRVKNLSNPGSAGSPTVSSVKLVLSKDKQSGEYQSGSSGSALSQSPSSGQRHNHHRHHRHEHGAQHKHHEGGEHKHHRKHHKHSSHSSVPAEYHSGDAHPHRSSSDGHRHNKYPSAATSTGTTGSSRPPPEKLSRTDTTYGNGHHGNTSATLSLGRQQQSGLNSIPSTYRITSLAPPPPPPPVPCDEPSYAPPPLPPE